MGKCMSKGARECIRKSGSRQERQVVENAENLGRCKQKPKDVTDVPKASPVGDDGKQSSKSDAHVVKSEVLKAPSKTLSFFMNQAQTPEKLSSHVEELPKLKKISFDDDSLGPTEDAVAIGSAPHSVKREPVPPLKLKSSVPNVDSSEPVAPLDSGRGCRTPNGMQHKDLENSVNGVRVSHIVSPQERNQSAEDNPRRVSDPISTRKEVDRTVLQETNHNFSVSKPSHPNSTLQLKTPTKEDHTGKVLTLSPFVKLSSGGMPCSDGENNFLAPKVSPIEINASSHYSTVKPNLGLEFADRGTAESPLCDSGYSSPMPTCLISDTKSPSVTIALLEDPEPSKATQDEAEVISMEANASPSTHFYKEISEYDIRNLTPSLLAVENTTLRTQAENDESTKATKSCSSQVSSSAAVENTTLRTQAETDESTKATESCSSKVSNCASNDSITVNEIEVSQMEELLRTSPGEGSVDLSNEDSRASLETSESSKSVFPAESELICIWQGNGSERGDSMQVQEKSKLPSFEPENLSDVAGSFDENGDNKISNLLQATENCNCVSDSLPSTRIQSDTSTIPELPERDAGGSVESANCSSVSGGVQHSVSTELETSTAGVATPAERLSGSIFAPPDDTAVKEGHLHISSVEEASFVIASDLKRKIANDMGEESLARSVCPQSTKKVKSSPRKAFPFDLHSAFSESSRNQYYYLDRVYDDGCSDSTMGAQDIIVKAVTKSGGNNALDHASDMPIVQNIGSQIPQMGSPFASLLTVDVDNRTGMRTNPSLLGNEVDKHDSDASTITALFSKECSDGAWMGNGELGSLKEAPSRLSSTGNQICGIGWEDCEESEVDTLLSVLGQCQEQVQEHVSERREPQEHDNILSPQSGLSPQEVSHPSNLLALLQSIEIAAESEIRDNELSSILPTAYATLSRPMQQGNEFSPAIKKGAPPYVESPKSPEPPALSVEGFQFLFQAPNRVEVAKNVVVGNENATSIVSKEGFGTILWQKLRDSMPTYIPSSSIPSTPKVSAPSTPRVSEPSSPVKSSQFATLASSAGHTNCVALAADEMAEIWEAFEQTHDL